MALRIDTNNIPDTRSLGARADVSSKDASSVDANDFKQFAALRRGAEAKDPATLRAVNQVGAAPGDLVAILEALKESGALRAELIVI